MEIIRFFSHSAFSIQSSQLAQFFTYKTELQNKQYHFKAPQVESYDIFEKPLQ